MKIYIWLF